jgi:hypothetical protein
MPTVYVSIGNSDDKLTQREWSAFWEHAGAVIRRWSAAIHGEWLSLPGAPYQNACWCIEVDEETADLILRPELVHLVRHFRQDSIAWAEATTTFLSAAHTEEQG